MWIIPPVPGSDYVSVSCKGLGFRGDLDKNIHDLGRASSVGGKILPCARLHTVLEGSYQTPSFGYRAVVGFSSAVGSVLVQLLHGSRSLCWEPCSGRVCKILSA